MSRAAVFYVSVLAMVALVFGCASAGTQSSTPIASGLVPSNQAVSDVRTVPDWVISPPTSTAQIEYFVANGKATSVSEATEIATGNLISTINLYLGVTVESVTEAEARATLETYETNIRQSIRQKSNGSIAGLTIQAPFMVPDNQGNVTVYLLGEYKKADLDAEKAKRAALIREREDAVSVPEAKGTEAERAGDLFEALRFYLEAAGVASGSDIANAEVKFERNINNARRIVGFFKLEVVSVPGETLVRTAFAQEFIAKIVHAETGRPISNADFEVVYNEYSATGATQVRRLQVKSDNEGLIKVRLPNPSKVGNERVNLSLNISSYTRPISNLRGNFRTVAGGVLDAVNAKRIVMDYSVVSNAKNVATAVLLMDLNENGSLNRATSLATDSVKSELAAAGFRIPTLSFGVNFLEGKGDEDIIALSKNTVGALAPRFAYGSIQVLSFETLNGQVLAKATGKINVIDTRNSTTIYSTTINDTGFGPTQADARRAVMTQLGKKLGQALINNLP